MTLQSFFAMGGYAAYVWPAYSIFFVVLLFDYLSPIIKQRRLLRELNTQLKRQTRRKARDSKQR